MLVGGKGFTCAGGKLFSFFRVMLREIVGSIFLSRRVFLSLTEGIFFLSRRVFLSLTEHTDLTELFYQRFEPIR